MAHPLVTGSVNFADLEAELGLSDFERTYVATNRSMIEGNHWLEGEGYVGAPPDPTDPKNADLLWAALRRAFTSKNIVKEVTDRQVSAILGQQPDYNLTTRAARKKVVRQVPDPSFVPDPANPTATAPRIPDPEGRLEDEPLSDNERALIDEGMAALSVYWDKLRPMKHLKEALRRRLWGGRSYLRAFVPGKYRRENGRVSFADGDFNEAIKHVFISTPDIENAVKLIDDESFDELTVVSYSSGKRKVVELVFLDDNLQTIIATVVAGAETAGVEVALPDAPVDNMAKFLLPPAPASVVADAEARLLANVPDENISDPLDLNGNLTVYELNGEPLISEQIRSNNMFVNLSLTMGAHVLVESGFSELAVTNVELETDRVADETAPGGFRDRPRKLKRGGHVVLNFVGMAQDDGRGGESLADPSITYKDPTPIDVFEKGKDIGYRNCLEEAHQVHALIAGDATPSGESRIMALADFVMFSMPYAEEIADAAIWLIETVLFWAAILAGKPGHFKTLRATFRPRIYVGKLSAQDRAALQAEVTARLRSRASYILAAEVNDDPEAELQAIQEEDAKLNPEKSLSTQRAQIGLQADRAALDQRLGGGTGGDPNNNNPPAPLPRRLPVPANNNGGGR